MHVTNASFYLTMLLEIARGTDAGPLPACTPSLMPFHISYSGPAPISRYFRPRPAPPPLTALSLRSSSTATLVASSSSTSILTETKSSLTTVSSTTSIGSLANENDCVEDGTLSMTRSSIEIVNQVEQATATQLVLDTATGMDLETQPTLDSTQLDSSFISTGANTRASRNVKRFVAAFRGRQMYGQAMDMPSGYGGLVLRAPLDSKGKDKEEANKARPMSRTRVATRRLKRTKADVPADEPEEGNDGDCTADSDMNPSPPTKILAPLSTFSSFMLWTPDRPLDEGRDEYARALMEWTRLATEVSPLVLLRTAFL